MKGTETSTRITRFSSSEIRTLPPGGPGVSVVGVLAPCGKCGTPTKVRVYGRPGHYGCYAPKAKPVQHPRPDQHIPRSGAAALESEEVATPAEVSMFRLLQESITASKKRPVLRITKDDRVLEPWALIVEEMRGEHRYRIDAPAGRTVKILDRNGSYPSAMANVPVAAGPLRHTGRGPLGTGHAGIYQIPAFDWDGPHPLGEIALQKTESWWVSTPHLKLCIRLAATGRIPAFQFSDSWTGNAVTNLFKVFSARVSELRELARPDEDAYGEIKRKSSIAIRALWPKGSRSPFWRPDWSVSVRAEAAVRHWVRADQAIQAGAELVRLGNVDEVAFLIPPRARQNWLPEPYAEGTGFGYVKTKGTQLAVEWNRPRRGKK